MIGFVILGVLAAFGALCVLWVLLGLLIPRPRGGRLVYDCEKAEEAVVLQRYTWLRELGLLKCNLILLDSSLPAQQQQQIREKCRSVAFYTGEEWIEILKQERIDSGRTGIADPAGDHRSGGLPEL